MPIEFATLSRLYSSEKSEKEVHDRRNQTECKEYKEKHQEKSVGL